MWTVYYTVCHSLARRWRRRQRRRNVRRRRDRWNKNKQIFTDCKSSWSSFSMRSRKRLTKLLKCYASKWRNETCAEDICFTLKNQYFKFFILFFLLFFMKFSLIFFFHFVFCLVCIEFYSVMTTLAKKGNEITIVTCLFVCLFASSYPP